MKKCLNFFSQLLKLLILEAFTDLVSEISLILEAFTDWIFH